jgi:hypothetical protein
LAILATITGLIGLWTFATGRPVLGVQHWPLEGRALRMVGAYTAAECVLVLIVAGTRGDGTAFIVFAVGSLVIGATVQLARRQQAT